MKQNNKVVLLLYFENNKGPMRNANSPPKDTEKL